MQGRQSATLDSSRVSRSSSAKPAQLPPLFEHKSNMIDVILTSKCSNRIHGLDPSIETYSDINKMLAADPSENGVVRNNKRQATDKLLTVILTKCRRIGQSVLAEKGKPDQVLIKHLKCSSSVRIALDNIYERMTRKGQINDELKGLNGQLLDDIEKELLDVMSKQIDLFKKGREYNRARNALLSNLELYRKSLRQDLQNLEFL